ncbi:hypothetical protein SGPA1_11970 [Streptomyces misionensis JCM 4497]
MRRGDLRRHRGGHRALARGVHAARLRPRRARPGGGAILAAQRPQCAARPRGAAARLARVAGHRRFPAARQRAPLRPFPHAVR